MEPARARLLRQRRDDAATGATVWTWDAPGGISGWPAVADDLVVWPVGLPNPAFLVGLRLPRG